MKKMYAVKWLKTDEDGVSCAIVGGLMFAEKAKARKLMRIDFKQEKDSYLADNEDAETDEAKHLDDCKFSADGKVSMEWEVIELKSLK